MKTFNTADERRFVFRRTPAHRLLDAQQLTGKDSVMLRNCLIFGIAALALISITSHHGIPADSLVEKSGEDLNARWIHNADRGWILLLPEICVSADIVQETDNRTGPDFCWRYAADRGWMVQMPPLTVVGLTTTDKGDTAIETPLSFSETAGPDHADHFHGMQSYCD